MQKSPILIFSLIFLFACAYAGDTSHPQHITLVAHQNRIILVGQLKPDVQKQYPKGYGLIVTVHPDTCPDELSHIRVTSYYVNPETYKEEERGSIILRDLLKYNNKKQKTVFLADFNEHNLYHFGVSLVNSRYKNKKQLRAHNYIHIKIASPEETALHGHYSPFYLQP